MTPAGKATLAARCCNVRSSGSFARLTDAQPTVSTRLLRLRAAVSACSSGGMAGSLTIAVKELDRFAGDAVQWTFCPTFSVPFA